MLWRVEELRSSKKRVEELCEEARGYRREGERCEERRGDVILER